MAETIACRFRPESAVDVGCGTGALRCAFRYLGCRTVFGLEYADAALYDCWRRGLPVRKFKIGLDTCAERYDLAVGFEVAEHLSPWVAERFIDLLCELAPIVAMRATTPGQCFAQR
jgi:hypothetical protein